MSRHYLAWIAALAGVLGSSTLLSQTAQAQGVWTGSATCTAKTTGNNYSEQQTHRWRIINGVVNSVGAMKQYSYYWSVTGSGADSSYTWKISGPKVVGYFQTWVDSTGHLNFTQVPSGGAKSARTATPVGGGKILPGDMSELSLFYPSPTMTVTVPANARFIQAPHGISRTTPTGVAFQAPSGSTTHQVCSWSFRLI